MAFKIVNLILCVIFKDDIQIISEFPTSYNNSYYWIIYTIFGLVLPLITKKIYNHIKQVKLK